MDNQLVREHWLLATLLLVVFTTGLYGITWGRVETWNPDQMALKPPFDPAAGYSPGWFLKPPFHSYTTYIMVRAPLIAVQKLTGMEDATQRKFELVSARVLTLLMYLGTLIVFYRILHANHGPPTALSLTALLGTGAGLFVDTHYLTADIPVLFWMVVAFYFAQRILHEKRLQHYLLAGFFTGLATATKYNGLAVGFAIPLAHVLAHGYTTRQAWRKLLSDCRVYYGIAAVPIGFIVASPFSVLDYRNFIADFIYNYQTAAVFDGSIEGHSYLHYFSLIRDYLGAPGSLLIAMAIIASLLLIALRANDRQELRLFILAAGVFLLYYAKFGSLPRLPARFILPSIPLLILLAAPIVWRIPGRLLIALVIPVVAYNLICAAYVGYRFTQDPRIQAQAWVLKNVTDNRTIESHVYVPKWSRLPGARLTEVRMPFVSGRQRLFEQILPEGSLARSSLDDGYERDEESLDWYTEAALLQRRPDFIAVNGVYYRKFFNPPLADLYPEIKQYFDDLLNERLPYRIVYEAVTPTPHPAWVYPADIEFLDGHEVTILERDDTQFGAIDSANNRSNPE